MGTWTARSMEDARRHYLLRKCHRRSIFVANATLFLEGYSFQSRIETTEAFRDLCGKSCITWSKYLFAYATIFFFRGYSSVG